MPEIKREQKRLSLRHLSHISLVFPLLHSDLKEQLEAASDRISKVSQCQIGYVNNPTDPLSGYGISGQEIGVAFKHSFKARRRHVDGMVDRI